MTGDNSNTSKGANSASNNARVSNDGRYVAFDSSATNLVPLDNNVRKDVFLRDMQQATGGNQSPYTALRRCSVDSSGAQGNGISSYPSMSSDGLLIAFESASTNLVTPASTGGQVFVRDWVNGTTYLVSKANDGTSNGNGLSGRVALSGNGLCAAFQSMASNLVAGDTNSVQDIFLRQTLLR